MDQKALYILFLCAVINVPSSICGAGELLLKCSNKPSPEFTPSVHTFPVNKIRTYDCAIQCLECKNKDRRNEAIRLLLKIVGNPRHTRMLEAAKALSRLSSRAVHEDLRHTINEIFQNGHISQDSKTKLTETLIDSKDLLDQKLGITLRDEHLSNKLDRNAEILKFLMEGQK